MKKTFTLILLATAFFANAQNYNFSYSTGTYAFLSDSISLNTGYVWDDPEFTIPFEFNFKIADETINKIYIEDYGMGAFLTTSLKEEGILPMIFGLGADIIDKGYVKDHSESEISYKVTGTSGSKICKIEWKNFGYYGELESDDTCIDYGNFQIWFYEGSNKIELHFGPGSVAQPELAFEFLPGPFIGIAEKYDLDKGEGADKIHFLIGDPTTPTLAYADSFSFLSGAVPNGMIYTFSSKTAGIEGTLENDVNIFPNPATDKVFIESDALIQNLTLMNVSGQTVLKQEGNLKELNTSELTKGTYFLEIQTEAGLIRKKLLLN